jgi:hypothetical protein
MRTANYLSNGFQVHHLRLEPGNRGVVWPGGGGGGGDKVKGAAK